MAPVPERFRPAVKELIDLLVAGDYEGLAHRGLLSHPDADTGMWIENYPATLVELPEEGWAESDSGGITNRSDEHWVVVPLWTAEEGRSDLTLEATVLEQNGLLTARVDQVHLL